MAECNADYLRHEACVCPEIVLDAVCAQSKRGWTCAGGACFLFDTHL